MAEPMGPEPMEPEPEREPMQSDPETAPSAGDEDRRSRQGWALALFLFIAIEGAGFQMRGTLVPIFERTFDAPTWQLGLIAPAGVS